ncbi:MAG: glutamine synthetase III, partial [Chlamydiota bacterium]
MKTPIDTIHNHKIKVHPDPKPQGIQSREFGRDVFDQNLMGKRLPAQVFENLKGAMEGRGKLNSDFADQIADVFKEWAIERGATHYTHWFQPLTQGTAEKHDSFLSWGSHGIVERFQGKDLMRGEPDASSFPTGGLRTTHQARGYTTWDLSPPFLLEGVDGVTLYIPSLFFSWKGEALDHKIPLLRSEERLNAVGMRLLKLCGTPGTRVFSTVGIEQEYFAIDRDLYLMRPDLVAVGRTVFGSRPAKGQELEDHYFGSLNESVLAFMRDFEEGALHLGIPLKTRHNEVAPAQYEVAPLFERGLAASDHNLLLMEVMRTAAINHGLACLFHEKPFAYVNGSGKHNNWSMATDLGLNLLDPKENSLEFLILLTAILRAVHEHAALLRASIGSAGNDHRLGGSEAPPTILSVFLGEPLEKLIEQLIEEKKLSVQDVRVIDLKISSLPPCAADPMDRNRTSFFAFTGNKFEFRAVGAPAHSAFPLSVINAIVADSLHLILDEIGDVVKDKALSGEALFAAILPTLRKHLANSQSILFGGNNYSLEWQEEAAVRGLPNIAKSFHAFGQLIEKKSISAFAGILSEEEIHSRYEVLVERYAKVMNIEVNLMIDLFRTQILPAAFEDQK